MGKRWTKRPVSLLASLPKELKKSILGERVTAEEKEEREVEEAVAEGSSSISASLESKGKGKQPMVPKPTLSYEELINSVPRYDDISQVPNHLRKYYSQRHRYFSLYDSGCLLDEEGWYSVTPEAIASRIAERCRCDVVLDAFCGVGGNAIAFAKSCERVIAMDISPLRLALARHNARIYGVEDRIEFILGDYVSFAKNYALRARGEKGKGKERERGGIDVVFLSPPWGGPAYLDCGSPTKENSSFQESTTQSTNPQQQGRYTLDMISPIPGDELFELTRQITNNVAFFLPRNVDIGEVGALVAPTPTTRTGLAGTVSKILATTEKKVSGEGQEVVEVEEAWMGNKLKAVTCYFGGLAVGQERLF